jgi:hypothetical protein
MFDLKALPLSLLSLSLSLFYRIEMENNKFKRNVSVKCRVAR